MGFVMRSGYHLLPTSSSEHKPLGISGKICPGISPRRFPLGIVLVVALVALTLTLNLIYLWSDHPRQISNPYAEFVSHWWPVGLPNRTDNWENENSKSMRALLTCMAVHDCSQNATSIVLLSSNHFTESILGHTSGEDIWASSVLMALREMGYTAIFSPDNYELARTYRQYPDLVKVAILEASRAQTCFEDAHCIKTDIHPLGIPAWKLLSFHFWPSSDNPLGNGWTLSPEDYSIISPHSSGAENVYLGYSIESTCKQIPFVSTSNRVNQAYVMTKALDYFVSDNFAWKNLSFIPPYPINVVSGIAHNGTNASVSLPPGIVDLGRLNRKEFVAELGKSRVLIGIGNPLLSPSPYEALCMGVPFVNPIMDWDRDDPDNRTKWSTQHDGLKHVEPPYVYHVKRNDGAGLWDAVKAAIEHPIERYIPSAMTMDALKRRVGEIVEGNWKAKAIAVLEERKVSGGKMFDI